MKATAIFSAPTMTPPARLTSDASSGLPRTSSKTGRHFRGGIRITPRHSKPSYKKRGERRSFDRATGAVGPFAGQAAFGKDHTSPVKRESFVLPAKGWARRPGLARTSILRHPAG